MLYLPHTFIFILGLIFGSFLNVLICRYRPEKNIFAYQNVKGRSHCPYCGKTLRFFELVPIFSFLFQGGRCHNCRHPLSLQYPIIELLSGIIFLSVPLFLSKFYFVLNFFRPPFDAPLWFYGLVLVWIAALLTLILIAAIDLRHYLIPDELNKVLLILACFHIFFLFWAGKNLPLFGVSFLKQYILLFSPTQNLFLNHLLGAATAFFFFWLVVFLSRGKAMGFGDVKMAFVVGLLFGWPDAGLIVVLSFIFGGIYGAFLIFSGRKKMRDKMPFAPFFVLAAFSTLFFGYQITYSYFKLFGIS